MTCSTASMNLRAAALLDDASRPFSTATVSPPAENVPTKTSLLAFWEMLMKPPAPASLPPNG